MCNFRIDVKEVHGSVQKDKRNGDVFGDTKTSKVVLLDNFSEDFWLERLDTLNIGYLRGSVLPCMPKEVAVMSCRE